MARNPDDERIDQRSMEAVMMFERVQRKYCESGFALISFTVRLPKFDGDDYLLVARVTVGEDRMVGFRNADFFPELFTGFVRAVQHGSLKLREDKYGD